MVLSERLRFTPVHSLLPEREAGWVAGFFPVEYGNSIHDELQRHNFFFFLADML